jgi:type IV pilus assembly protein PilM
MDIQRCGIGSAYPSSMALPFLKNQSRSIDQVVAFDLGGRQTKAVHVQGKGGRLTLLGYVVQDAPNHEKGFEAASLGAHLKEVFKAFGDRTRNTALAVGVPEAFVRHAELPPMSIPAMRQALTLNSKTYLQQDFPEHVFDCSIIFSKPIDPKRQPSPAPSSPSAAQKQKVLVGGTKRLVLEALKQACKAAGALPCQIGPGMIGPVNAFELAEPDLFAKQVLALVDVGFKHTTITLLKNGELIMNRVVTIGGDHLTASLAETLGITHAEAEGIKVGMPAEVQQNLELSMAALARELRASIDFFEHQNDLSVSQVFLSGGSARSESLVRSLQTELMLPCRIWNPAERMQLSLPAQQRAGLEQVAPQLAVAIGEAVAAL